MVKEVFIHFEEHDRRIFWSVVFLLSISLAAYVYFLSISVYAVVTRKVAESRATSVSAHVSSLESQYVALDKRIDLALAHERGFADIAVPKYLSQGGPNKTLTLRTDNDTIGR